MTGSSVLKPNYNASVKGFNLNQMLWDSESSRNRENVSFIFAQVQTESRQRDSRSSESGSKKNVVSPEFNQRNKSVYSVFTPLFSLSSVHLLFFSGHKGVLSLTARLNLIKKFLAHSRCSKKILLEWTNGVVVM